MYIPVYIPICMYMYSYKLYNILLGTTFLCFYSKTLRLHFYFSEFLGNS